MPPSEPVCAASQPSLPETADGSVHMHPQRFENPRYAGGRIQQFPFCGAKRIGNGGGSGFLYAHVASVEVPSWNVHYLRAGSLAVRAGERFGGIFAKEAAISIVHQFCGRGFREAVHVDYYHLSAYGKSREICNFFLSGLWCRYAKKAVAGERLSSIDWEEGRGKEGAEGTRAAKRGGAESYLSEGSGDASQEREEEGETGKALKRFLFQPGCGEPDVFVSSRAVCNLRDYEQAILLFKDYVDWSGHGDSALEGE